MSLDDRRWKGGSRDVLKVSVFSRIVSKVLVDKGVLGWQGEFTILFKEMEVVFMVDDVGKDTKFVADDGRQGYASDDIGRAVWDVEERVVLLVFKSGPDKLGTWGTWDRSKG